MPAATTVCTGGVHAYAEKCCHYGVCGVSGMEHRTVDSGASRSPTRRDCDYIALWQGRLSVRGRILSSPGKLTMRMLHLHQNGVGKLADHVGIMVTATRCTRKRVKPPFGKVYRQSQGLFGSRILMTSRCPACLRSKTSRCCITTMIRSRNRGILPSGPAGG